MQAFTFALQMYWVSHNYTVGNDMASRYKLFSNSILNQSIKYTIWKVSVLTVFKFVAFS